MLALRNLGRDMVKMEAKGGETCDSNLSVDNVFSAFVENNAHMLCRVLRTAGAKCSNFRGRYSGISDSTGQTCCSEPFFFEVVPLLDHWSRVAGNGQ